MFRRLWAFLTKGECVILQAYEGEVFYTIAYLDPFGKKTARVYWFSRIGLVILNEDGTTSGRSSYINRWMKG